MKHLQPQVSSIEAIKNISFHKKYNISTPS